MIHFWQSSQNIKNASFIPKYYDPDLDALGDSIRTTHDCQTIESLVASGVLTVSAGDELGKLAYGTGNIPFVRTSDIANWEIKSSPKQGISEQIYEEYAKKQDVAYGDILFVRDGTYLIGNNCFIQEVDKAILFQSHVLKLRVMDKNVLDPHLLFLALNNPWVQRQIRTKQFTADTIDTLGQRFFELVLPFPKNIEKRNRLISVCKNALEVRAKGKAFIKNFPRMMENSLKLGSSKPIYEFLARSEEDMLSALSTETVTSEFGSFFATWRTSASIKNQIYLPVYYADDIQKELNDLSDCCDLRTIGELSEQGEIDFHTGDEPGKMAYGTGSIPFLRTSDFSNWEILHNPKQGVSEAVFQKYSGKQDIQAGDVLLVRDGTYLVGSSCLITEQNQKSIFCGGMFKFRVLKGDLDPYLFLGLLNAYVVKRQFRSKQFTRDVIDTLGNRIEEVILPVPRSKKVRETISSAIEQVITSRIQARATISKLAAGIGLSGE